MNLIFQGRVYNVTPYLEYHPGGIPELMRGVGRDGTDLFDEVRICHWGLSYEIKLQLYVYCVCNIVLLQQKFYMSFSLQSLKIDVLKDSAYLQRSIFVWFMTIRRKQISARAIKIKTENWC